MQRTGAHLYFEFATDFVLYYSHDCHSPACLQWRRNPPQIGHRQEQTRRCGVAAQRWRFTVRAVSGHGPAMHSTRLHANAAAAAAAAADGDGQVNVMTAMKLPTTARAHTLLSNSSGCSRSVVVRLFAVAGRHRQRLTLCAAWHAHRCVTAAVACNVRSHKAREHCFDE